LGLTLLQASIAAAIFAVASLALFAWVRRRAKRALEIERALTEALERYESIVNLSADAIITIDDAQNIVTFNRGAETIFGWEAAAIVGRPLNLLIPERFRNAHTRHVQTFGRAAEVARRMGERRPVFGLRHDGTEFPADASIARLELPSGRLFSVVLRDASLQARRAALERHLAQAGLTLAASLDYEGTLQSIAHIALPAVADCAVLDVLEPDGSIRRIASTHDDDEATTALRELNGRLPAPNDSPFPTALLLAPNAATQMSGPPAWATDDSSAARVLKVIGARACLSLPLRARDRVVGALHLIATDPQRVFDVLSRDLADKLAFRSALTLENAALYRAAQHATLLRDEIVSVVSHDLRNPLSAISMCSRVLVTSPPSDPAERDRLLDAIAEASALAERLIRDLLDASIIAAGQLRLTLEKESVRPLLEQLRSMFEHTARQRNITLVVEGPPDGDASLDVDAARLLQVLSNLVGNAIKFTESGGAVHVRASLSESALHVFVEDTGIGIPKEDLPHIFERYWHSKRKGRAIGSGLGLAIARGIVEAHGGTIGAESERGRGSTFSFVIPRRNGSAAP
jgi:PAS domain S-box-containing protein